MRTVTGLFETDAQARDAVRALEDAGVATSDISLISPGMPENAAPRSEAAEGAGIGTALGGVGGLLAGLGAFAIPGIGPVVGAGWLATTLIGALAGGAAGGAIGAMTKAGVDERDAHLYAESVRRGSSLVSARVDEEQVDAAAAILGQSGSVDMDDRRSRYEADGWAAFEENSDPRHYRREDDPASGGLPPPLPQ